jgi:hypothetical protein
MKLVNLLAGTALAFGAATAANAVPVNGTFEGSTSVGPFAGLLAVGSSIDILSALGVSGTGDLSAVSSTPLTVATPVVLSVGSLLDFTLSGFGSFSGTISAATLTSLPTGRIVSIAVMGTFTPSFGSFTPGPAKVTGAATQTGGAGSSVSFSFTFDSTPVPAPAALAIFGLGLVGLGLARRAR